MNEILPQRKEIRLQGYDYSCQGNYFVTIVVQNRQCLFGSVVDGNMQQNAAGDVIEQALMQISSAHDGVTLPCYVVMPDHIHFIVSLPGDISLSEIIRRFKSYTTHLYIEGVTNNGWPRFNGKLWQHNYYEHILRNQRDYENTVNYIVTNPERVMERANQQTDRRTQQTDRRTQQTDRRTQQTDRQTQQTDRQTQQTDRQTQQTDRHKVSPYIVAIIMAVGLMGCSSGSDDVVPTPTPAPTPAPVEEMAISFNSGLAENETVTRSMGNKAVTRNMSNKAVTRATTPLHEKGINTFRVWGYKNMSFDAGVYGDLQTVMPEYTVNWQENSANTTTSNTNGWEYVNQQTSGDEQTIKYWDWNAKAYRFFGVTGGLTGTSGTYGASGAYGTYEITLNADASSTTAIENTPYFTTLWFSTGNVGDYPDKQFGKPVQLEFLKPYARVRFLFKYAYPREGIKLGTKSFKPTTDGDKIARKGTVTVHYPKDGTETKEWYTMAALTGTGSGELDEFTVDYDPEDDGKNYVTLSSGKMTSDGWYIVLPNNTQGSYTLSVTVNGEAKTAVMPEQYMQWLPGYSYTYVFKITDEGGVEIGWVEYAMTPWTDLAADRTTYNW